jgi:hypothetical protein
MHVGRVARLKEIHACHSVVCDSEIKVETLWNEAALKPHDCLGIAIMEKRVSRVAIEPGPLATSLARPHLDRGLGVLTLHVKRARHTGIVPAKQILETLFLYFCFFTFSIRVGTPHAYALYLAFKQGNQ